jgi:uncharacterized protein YdaU (DUF1376 family)
MAGRPDSFMPLWIGDYLADTGHLSAAEHGAYLLLLMHYWRTGKPLPIEDGALARVARMSKEEWAASREVVTAFFQITVMDTVTVLAHKRVEAEMDQARGKYESRKAASDRANAAKKAAQERTANRNGYRDGDRDGDREVTQSQSQSQSSNEDKPSLREGGPPKPRKRSLPEDCPNEHDREAALTYWRSRGRQDLCPSIEDEIQSFRDHYRANGETKLDWSAGWRTWYGKTLKWSKPPMAQQQSRFPTANILKVV